MEPYRARVIRNNGLPDSPPIGNVGWVVCQYHDSAILPRNRRIVCEVKFTFGVAIEDHYHRTAVMYLDDLERV